MIETNKISSTSIFALGASSFVGGASWREKLFTVGIRDSETAMNHDARRALEALHVPEDKFQHNFPMPHELREMEIYRPGFGESFMSKFEETRATRHEKEISEQKRRMLIYFAGMLSTVLVMAIGMWTALRITLAGYELMGIMTIIFLWGALLLSPLIGKNIWREITRHYPAEDS